MDLSRNIKQLTGEADWPMWKRKIRDLLDYHEGAIEVIDGNLKKPEPIAVDATEAERKRHKELCDLYRKANSYAKSMIASTVTDSVYQKIMDKDTAYEAWDSLKQQFEATSKDQLFNICTEFFAFCWIQGEDVSTHIAKLRSLWNELNNGLEAKNENRLPDLLLVCKVLQILPLQFETFKSSWMLLSSDDRKSFEELSVQLCMYERNFTKADDSSKVCHEALAVAKSEKSNYEGKNKFRSRKKDTCNYCKRKGHWVKDCRQWISDGRPQKIHSNSASANISMMSICEEALATETNSDTFWIDNGATRHVTNCSTYFVDFTKFDYPCSIKAAGNELLDALGKGTIKFIANIHGKYEEIVLYEVWYVPKISRNLFSVLAAQDRNKNSKFVSTPTECWLKVKNKVVLHGTRNINGTLFKADIEPILPTEVHVIETENSLLQLYHERFGHQDKRHVRNLMEKELGISVNLDKELCEPCIYGKAHRLPFGNRKKATEPGELITADVCGPFDESFQKKRYFVLFKDSFTKFRYGYIIREKSEVKTVLKHMLAHAKVLGHSIKEFLSDNGGEFDNEEIKAILSSKGITQRLTAPYTPEQNGGSEREMRTIVEMARTFKYANPEADFPAAIWAELVNSAIFILNRTGKSSVEGKSPYELWLKKKPRLKHLRVIGSTCYAHIPSQRRRKMDKKAIKGYLVGYDGDERYRIYIKKTHSVILSRDVIFQERTGICDNSTEISLQDNAKEVLNQGKCEEEKENSMGDQKKNLEISDNSDSDDEDAEPISQKQLRNRSLLRKPKRFEDHIMEAESYISEDDTPSTYEEAINSKDNLNWKKAMENEMNSLKENHTWELTDLPSGARAISCKWVYRLKTNPDGSINKYKARVVAKGFSQRQGIDYSETFSPVAKLGTIRAVLSIAAEERMHLTQFDVSTAFLYGNLEETIYMTQPEGFTDGTAKVCKLKRSLYGLKQSPRCWNQCFGQFLTDLGFKASEADPCLYIRTRKDRKLLIALYVDDGLIASTDQQDSEMFIKELKEKFKISVGEVTCFLGLEIKQHNDSVTVSQTAYARKILQRFGFDECKPVATPMLKDKNVGYQEGDTKTTVDFPYRQAIGALMYLMIGTRPDLAYSVGFLSRSLENPSTEDIVRVKRVFRYIAGTVNYGITYRATSDKKGILQCYSDSDFGGCTKTGRSTTGYVMIYAEGAITWRSQRQAIVATSTTEAEVIAASEAAKEVIWLRRLFRDIVDLKEVPTLQVDNRAAVKLAHNPEYHRRTKHIEIKHFFVREKVLEGKLNVEQVSTEHQVSDILTKPLTKSRQLTLCDQMGLFQR